MMLHSQEDSKCSSIAFCICGEGFSGKDVQKRLAQHIENPDPESTGALLITFVKGN